MMRARSSWFSIIRANHLRRMTPRFLWRFFLGPQASAPFRAAPTPAAFRPRRASAHGRSTLVVSWIGDGDRRFAADPLAGDIALVLEKRLVRQRQSRHVRPPSLFASFPLAFPSKSRGRRMRSRATYARRGRTHPGRFRGSSPTELGAGRSNGSVLPRSSRGSSPGRGWARAR